MYEREIFNKKWKALSIVWKYLKIENEYVHLTKLRVH